MGAAALRSGRHTPAPSPRAAQGSGTCTTAIAVSQFLMVWHTIHVHSSMRLSSPQTAKSRMMQPQGHLSQLHASCCSDQPCCFAEQTLCGSCQHELRHIWPGPHFTALRAHALSAGSGPYPTSHTDRGVTRPRTAVSKCNQSLGWHACWGWPSTAGGSPSGGAGVLRHQEPSSPCICPCRNVHTICCAST